MNKAKLVLKFTDFSLFYIQSFEYDSLDQTSYNYIFLIASNELI